MELLRCGAVDEVSTHRMHRRGGRVVERRGVRCGVWRGRRGEGWIGLGASLAAVAFLSVSAGCSVAWDEPATVGSGRTGSWVPRGGEGTQ